MQYVFGVMAEADGQTICKKVSEGTMQQLIPDVRFHADIEAALPDSRQDKIFFMPKDEFEKMKAKS